MTNEYINPFNNSASAAGVSRASVSSVASVSDVDTLISSNNSTTSSNYILSPTDLREEDIELIKKELKRKIQEQKEALENTKETRSQLASVGNSILGWFNRGDKKVENTISNYESLLAGLENDISNIDEVYKKIMGTELDLVSLQTLQGNKSTVESLSNDEQNAIISELESQIAQLESDFKTAKNSNGWISGAWDKIKNITGIGAGSNKTQAEINDLKDELEDLKNGKIDLASAYKNIMGSDLTVDNLNSFLNNEEGKTLKDLSSAGKSLNNYTEGQKMATDVVADMASGIASVGVVAFGTAVGICAAPFTAGASLAMVGTGLAMAGATGALVKSAIKASDCIGNEKTYSLKDVGYDFVTGGINGLMGPVTNAMGGAVGTGIMKAFGMEALETTVKSGALLAGKEVVEEVVENTAKQTAKQTIVKALSFSANSMVDGGLSGIVDSSSRAIAEGRYEDIVSDSIEGLKGGLIASPIIGGGFVGAGKLGTKFAQTALGETIGETMQLGGAKIASTIDNILPQGVKRVVRETGDKISEKISQTALKNCLTIDADGVYSVQVGGYKVQLVEDELSEEILEKIANGDNSSVYEYAQRVLDDYLNPKAVEVVQVQEDLEKLDVEAKETASDVVEIKTEEVIQDATVKAKTFTIEDLENIIGGENYKLEEIFNQFPKEVEYLATMKTNFGEYRFNDNNIIKIMENYSGNEKAVMELVNMVRDDGEYRFNTRDIICLLPKYDEFKEQIVKLSDLKVDGQFRFNSGSAISALVEKYDKYATEIIELAKMTDLTGRYVFAGSDIALIADDYIKSKDLIEELVQMQNSRGKARFKGKDIAEIVIRAEKYQKEEIIGLLNLKNEKGAYRFNGKQISFLMDDYVEHPNAVEKLANVVDSSGDHVYDDYELRELFRKCDKYEDEILFLAGVKDFDGEPSFTASDILKLAEKANGFEKEIEYFTSLEEDGIRRFDIEDIDELLNKCANYKNEVMTLVDVQRLSGAKFDASEICLLADKYAQYPDEVNALLNMTDNLGIVQRFEASDIAVLADKYSQYKDLIEEIASIEAKGTLVGFNGQDIINLLEVYPKYKEQVIELSKLADGNNARFSSKEISLLADKYTQDGYRTQIDSLSIILDKQGDSRFSAKDIITLMDEWDINQEGILELANIANFSGEEISQLLPYISQKEEIIALANRKPAGLLRNNFSASDICMMVKNYSENLEEIVDIANKHLRFDAKEICAIVELNHNYSEIFNDLQQGIDIKQIIRYYEKGKIDEVYNNYANLKDIVLKVSNDRGINIEKRTTLINELLGYRADYSEMSLKQKIHKIDILQQLQEYDGFSEEEKKLLNIDGLITYLQGTITNVIDVTPVSAVATKQMMSGFFANNNPQLDNLLSTTDFTNFGKNGLPLEYSRTSFLGDLSNIIENVPENEKTDILNKLGISLVNENGNIGYNGIINLNKLSNEGVEGEVLAIAKKFILENSISTGNSELDDALNSLIQGMPEFINIIGKQQHTTHDFSVDIHMLTVLKEAMSNPSYQNLSNQDKFCLKFATILHDVAKMEGVVDDGHSDLCALYVRDILRKFSFPEEMKDRIFELVKNHHWLANYNQGLVSADTTATLFRRTSDLNVAQIMAEADLKGVDASGKFYNDYSNALDEAMQTPIQDRISRINQTGQMFLTNKVIDSRKIPVVTYKGQEYKVINFTQLVKDTDLQQFGFEPGSTVDNLRIMVHMADIPDLEGVWNLKDPNYEGYLCASYVSVEQHPTYCGQKFGVSIETEQANIGNAIYQNQGSGNGKNFDRFSATLLEKDWTGTQYRELIPDSIKATLKLTDKEYAELFSQVQKYKYTSQLDNIAEIKIGEKTFTGEEVKEAILKADDEMLKYATMGHNEANLYTPKVNAVVAKVNSMDEVPEKLLAYAKAHNLPIYLLGE